MSGHRRDELFVDRIIREAMERGEFDDLRGQGEPIPGVGEIDTEGWWVRRWVERNREALESSADGPPPST